VKKRVPAGMKGGGGGFVRQWWRGRRSKSMQRTKKTKLTVQNLGGKRTNTGEPFDNEKSGNSKCDSKLSKGGGTLKKGQKRTGEGGGQQNYSGGQSHSRGRDKKGLGEKNDLQKEEE